MQAFQEVEELSDPDPPPQASKKKPGFMSKEWFLDILRALLMWRYSAREWGIFNLSSLFTDIKWVSILVGSGVWSKTAAIMFFKNLWLKLIAFVTAIFEVLFNW